MRTIAATVRSPGAVSGQYRLVIRSTGNGNTSTVSQGGDFSAPADEDTSVGQVQINAGTRYSIDFSITVEGETIDCTQNGARFT